jgi:hypothetical protein
MTVNQFILQIKAFLDPAMNGMAHDKHCRRGCRLDIPIFVYNYHFLFPSGLQNLAGQISTQ